MAHRLDDKTLVAGQIGPADVPALKAEGVKMIINNRPDGEAPDQPASATLAAAAAAHGLDYRFVPVVPGRFDDATVEAMTCALQELPRPVLAFCRTGTRSTSLWALQAARHSDLDTLLDVASEAGYDLSGLMPILQRVRS